VFDSIRAVMREPLLHFLLAGAGLFLLFNYVSEPDATGDDRIVVTSGQIEHLTTLFVKTWQRAPRTDELQGLIDNFILEEVLYREATAIGLDQDDTIIRRRLKQKMEFLVDDFSAADPADIDLQQFLQNNPERFRTEARITFEHVYFADAGSGAVKGALAALQNGEPIDSILTTPSGLLPQHFDNASAMTVSGQFGENFKDLLFSLETGQWTGPVESPFGVHLVKIDKLVEGRVPALDEVRDVVQREWLLDRRKAAQQAFFDSLRDKYTITIEDHVAPEA
jgi:hypothetical protein